MWGNLGGGQVKSQPVSRVPSRLAEHNLQESMREASGREGDPPLTELRPDSDWWPCLRVQDHTFASGTLVQTQPRPSTLHGDCLSDQLVLLQFPPPHSVLSILWSKEQHANTQGQARAHGKAAGGELPHGMLLLLEQ